MNAYIVKKELYVCQCLPQLHIVIHTEFETVSNFNITNKRESKIEDYYYYKIVTMNVTCISLRIGDLWHVTLVLVYFLVNPYT